MKTSTLSNGSDVSQLVNRIGFDPDSFSSYLQEILGIDVSILDISKPRF